jgi:hypothetical protein
MAQRNERGDGDQAAVAWRQVGVGPDLRLQRAFDQCGELGRECARSVARAGKIDRVHGDAFLFYVRVQTWLMNLLTR